MNSRIPTDSRRQTLDWSLALASQGIEATLDYNEGAGWGLLVEEQEVAKALTIIHLYRIENQHWPWQQKLFPPSLAFDWGSLAWVFLLCLFFGLSENMPQFREAGMMQSLAVTRGEWWRLFTAVFLHADLGHLAANATIGLVLLGLAMAQFGTGIGLLGAFLAGAIGNVASWLSYNSSHQSLGASGMVMGSLGLLATQSFSHLSSTTQHLKSALGGLAAGGMLFVLTGLSPGTDVMAHLGGFLGGILLGIPLTLLPQLGRNTLANLLAGAGFVTLSLLTWWRAAQTIG